MWQTPPGQLSPNLFSLLFPGQQDLPVSLTARCACGACSSPWVLAESDVLNFHITCWEWHLLVWAPGRGHSARGHLPSPDHSVREEQTSMFLKPLKVLGQLCYANLALALTMAKLVHFTQSPHVNYWNEVQTPGPSLQDLAWSRSSSPLQNDAPAFSACTSFLTPLREGLTCWWGLNVCVLPKGIRWGPSPSPGWWCLEVGPLGSYWIWMSLWGTHTMGTMRCPSTRTWERANM